MDVKNLIAQTEVELEAANQGMRRAKAAGALIIDTARQEGRTDLTDAECAESDKLFGDFEMYKANVKGIKDKLARARKIQSQDDALDASMRETPIPTERSAGSGTTLYGIGGRGTAHKDRDAGDMWTYREGKDHGMRANVLRGESFGSHPLIKDEMSKRYDSDRRIMDAHGNDFGMFLRAMSTTSGGTALVPTTWNTDIIDLARNNTVLFEAGATLIPMDRKVVKMERLTTDPTPAFRNEGSTITEADMAFDNVTLTATSLSALVVTSLEFLQDAPNAGEAIQEALAKKMALQLDYVGLYGQLAAGNEGAVGNLASPNPLGLLQALIAYNSASQILGAATNGTTQTSTTPFLELTNTLYKVKRGNEHPTALISNVALAQIYDSMYSTQNQPLIHPPILDSVPWLTTNAIDSFTAGTMTSVATDVFAGDFSQMLIGQRMGLDIQVLTERYAELGQVGFRAYWRGDVQLARPAAFAAYRYLKGAA